ncbi:hypothetical protein HD806DRAFT_62966 [Xylariaceae sp. AK1471]|nr:hypothetical protein HD806DRAFT_62966 [Xylariaceae sp. AK1471]
MSWNCDTCDRVFGSWQALNQHAAALGHRRELYDPDPLYPCDRCGAVYRSEAAVNAHMRTYNHWKYRCSCCSLTGPTEAGIKQHEIEDHLWCSVCSRIFQSYNNIKMHLNSQIHRGKSVKCIFCPLPFTTVAGLAHHLETGSCANAPSLNRDELYKAIRRHDPSGVITKKLIGWQGSTHYEATAQTWNGDYYECYFCHREFNTLPSLNQHLQSPIHQQKLYHCPNPGCAKEFTSLAAVCNHLESESCSFMRFQDVQGKFQGIMSGNRLITH